MNTRKSRTQRRQDLIEAARRAMIQHGTDTVLLNQVAEQAGLTSGAVLYHYPDLRDLLLEAHHAGMERFYELRVKKIAGQQCPEGWLIDSEGRPTTDPATLYGNPPGSILPGAFAPPASACPSATTITMMSSSRILCAACCNWVCARGGSAACPAPSPRQGFVRGLARRA